MLHPSGTTIHAHRHQVGLPVDLVSRRRQRHDPHGDLAGGTDGKVTRSARGMDLRLFAPGPPGVGAHCVRHAAAVVPDCVGGPVGRDLDPGPVVEPGGGQPGPGPGRADVMAHTDRDVGALEAGPVVAHRDEVEGPVRADREIDVGIADRAVRFGAHGNPLPRPAAVGALPELRAGLAVPGDEQGSIGVFGHHRFPGEGIDVVSRIDHGQRGGLRGAGRRRAAATGPGNQRREDPSDDRSAA